MGHPPEWDTVAYKHNRMPDFHRTQGCARETHQTLRVPT